MKLEGSFLKVYKFIRDNKLDGDGLAQLEKLGMIPKHKLKDRAYYIGVCRNTNIAQWIEKPKQLSKDKLPNDCADPCFYYMREKFGNIYVDVINHPEDDNGYDLFIPLKEIEV